MATKKTPLQQIIERHPRIFRGEHPAIVSWVPPGWFALVDHLYTKIENVLDADVQKITVVQVKEKYAGLRFYYQLDLPEPPGEPPPPAIRDHAGGFRISGRSRNPLKRAVDELIDVAEKESLRVCEWCGSRERVQVMVGGQAPNPINADRSLISPGLYHTCCAACRGDAVTPEERRSLMEERRAEIKRKMDQDQGEDKP